MLLREGPRRELSGAMVGVDHGGVFGIPPGLHGRCFVYKSGLTPPVNGQASSL